MKLALLFISLMLLAGLSACSTSSSENDEDLLIGEIEEITFECGGWGLRTNDGFYELVNLPEAFETDGLRVRISHEERNDLISCNMAGPVIEVLRIYRD